MVRIRRSHRRGRGSIPRLGTHILVQHDSLRWSCFVNTSKLTVTHSHFLKTDSIYFRSTSLPSFTPAAAQKSTMKMKIQVHFNLVDSRSPRWSSG